MPQSIGIGKVNLLITMGGLGSRFGMEKLKPLILVNGKPMFRWAEESAKNFLKLAFPHENHHLFGCINQDYLSELESLQRETASELVIYPLQHQTRGPAESVYLCELTLNEPLMIHDCDLVANPIIDQTNIRNFTCDVGLYYTESNNPQHSYIKIDSGNVTEIAEKKMISKNGVVGIYYFKSKEFFDYLYNKTEFKHEYFISDLVNTAIKLNYKVEANPVASCLSLGTPEELSQNKTRISISFFEVNK
jgi:dTDP-glucose pyrophosphorylase